MTHMLRCFGLIVWLLVGTAPAFAQNCPPSLPPSPYEKQVKVGDIADAIFRGDWKHALDLAADYATKYLSTCSNQQKIVSALSKASKTIKKIVDDPTKTEEQKRAEVYKLIDDSILASQGTNRLGDINEANASYRYSLSYGIARLEFDVTARDDRCAQYWGIRLDYSFPDFYTGAITSGGVTYSYVEARHYRTPNVYIFRQVSGFPEELVVRFDGQTRGGLTTSSWGGPGRSWVDATWDAARTIAWQRLLKRYNGKPTQAVTRMSVDLPTSAYLQPGRTLAYRIAEEWPRWDFPKGNNCEQTFYKHSLIYIDSNADGRVDALTAAEYSAHFAALRDPAETMLLLE
jgi:hypothetical protein